MTITALSDVDPCEAKFAQVAEVLESAHTVTILCHVQPDADTIGSGLALGLVLERRGISVQVAFSRPSRCPSRCVISLVFTCSWRPPMFGKVSMYW